MSGSPGTSIDPARELADAEAALAAQETARAIVLFGRYLARDGVPVAGLRQAYLGLAKAHEQNRDCVGAVRAYQGYLDRFSSSPGAVGALMRLAACEAELERWEASAASYAKVSAAKNQLPSVYIEALARQGYALFNLDRQGEADAVLAAADDVFDKAQAEQSERFSTYYFVGMARFYRAAILHWKFRDVEFSSGQSKAQLEKAFYRKMELLSLAQDAYYHAIRAKHMFWVSASGYQLGRLFGEFYDAVMYAPVPSWLNDHQRVVYFEELKKQSRPVIEKAIWQLERNLDAARRLGYESPFVELTEAKLTHLRGVLLSGDSLFGKPHPRLVPELAEDIGPQGGDETELSAVDRELFVPLPTPL